jgi:hypothetical protein
MEVAESLYLKRLGSIVNARRGATYHLLLGELWQR